MDRKDTVFTAEYQVTIGDINYGGHVGNDRYLLIFHDARIQFLQSLGLNEGDIGDGTSLIMTEAHVKFLGEVFLHDRLYVHVWISGLQGTRFTMEYRIEKAADGTAAAEGYTKLSAFDYEKRKLTRLPLSFAGKIAGLQ